MYRKWFLLQNYNKLIQYGFFSIKINYKRGKWTITTYWKNVPTCPFCLKWLYDNDKITAIKCVKCQRWFHHNCYENSTSSICFPVYVHRLRTTGDWIRDEISTQIKATTIEWHQRTESQLMSPEATIEIIVGAHTLPLMNEIIQN